MIRRVASIPSSSGIRMSISTTVGSNRRRLLDRLQPGARLGDHLDVRLAGQQEPEARADHRLIVGDEDRGSSQRRGAWRARSRRRSTDPAAHRAAVDLHPLADADEPVAEPVVGRGAATVVAHLDPQLVRRVARRRTSARRARACFSAFVSPSWTIRYADRSSAARERDLLAVDLQPDGQARATERLDERVERPEARLRRELDAPRPRAARRAAGASPSAPRGRSVSTQTSASRSSEAGQPVPDRARLQHHDAHRVGDDVVQLARDPRALLGDRDPGRDLALALRPRRALLGRLGLRRAPAQRRSRRATRSRTAAGWKSRSPVAWFGSL